MPIHHFFLRCAAVAALLGAGWLALTSGLSLRELVWDEAAFGLVPSAFGFSWSEWVTSAAVDRGITLTEKAVGVVFILFAGLLALRRKAFFGLTTLVAASAALLFLRAFLFWKGHFYQVGALLETCIQTLAPLLYVLFWVGLNRLGTENKQRPSGNVFWFLIRFAVALTFVGHGLYAIGFHPVPAHFVFMTQAGLGVGEGVARQLLFGVGVLDFLAAALLLLPWRRAWFAGLVWIVPWAVLTTFARVWSYGGFVGFDTLLTQWLPQMVVRFPHVLLPLALLFWARSQDAGLVEEDGLRS